MSHLIGRILVQVILALSPLITLPWSLVDYIGYKVTAVAAVGIPEVIESRLFGLPVVGTKSQVELTLRASAIVFALLVSASIDVFSQVADVYIPRRRLQDFRGDYLNEKKKEWAELTGKDVRVCVMFARRPWHFPFTKKLYWSWNTGFDPPDRHLDANIAFWQWQGVCGRTLARAKPQFADFRKAPDRPQSRWLWQNDFRLGPIQFVRTRDVKAILCVPLYAKVGRDTESPSWRAVGVISIDAMDDAAAELLATNRENLQKYLRPSRHVNCSPVGMRCG